MGKPEHLKHACSGYWERDYRVCGPAHLDLNQLYCRRLALYAISVRLLIALHRGFLQKMPRANALAFDE